MLVFDIIYNLVALLGVTRKKMQPPREPGQILRIIRITTFFTGAGSKERALKCINSFVKALKLLVITQIKITPRLLRKRNTEFHTNPDSGAWDQPPEELVFRSRKSEFPHII